MNPGLFYPPFNLTLQPGFLKYHQDKTTAKDGPRIGASPTGRVKKSVVHAPTEPKAIHAMPVVAVIGAIVSFSAGAGIVAGGIGAIAAGSMAAMVVGGAMMVGAALTVVGVVTGNEKLMKVGGILSLAGGIGAGVAGLMGAAGGTAGAAGATAGLEAAQGVGAAAADGVSNAAISTQALAGNIADQAGGGILGTAGDAGVAANTAASTATNAANAATSAVSAIPAVEAASTATNPFAPITDTPMKAGQIDTSAFDKTTFNANNSAGGGILDWMNKNKQATELIGGAVKGAASMVPTDQSKANTALTKEQISALQLQQERDKRRLAYAQGKLYKGG